MKQITPDKLKNDMWILLYYYYAPEYGMQIAYIKEEEYRGVSANILYSGKMSVTYSYSDMDYDRISLLEMKTHFSRFISKEELLYRHCEIFSLTEEEKDMVIADSLFETDMSELPSKPPYSNHLKLPYNDKEIQIRMKSRLLATMEEEEF